MNCSLSELVTQVNAWCKVHRITPASGQASEELTVRTMRYYRSAGLLDAPSAGGGSGYERRHFLQVVAVRILQCQGLPLNRIHALLFGRSDSDLERIAELSASEGARPEPPVTISPFLSSETWQVTPLTDQYLLVSRRGPVSPAIQERLRAILSANETSQSVSPP